MEKYGRARQATDGSIIQYVCIACWITKTTDTLEIFYFLLTMHLGVILINNQLDAQLLLYIFILILHMFRATLCSSSGELIVSIQHLVHVTLCR